MKRGKAFELFVKQLLINVGFSEVNSDGLFVFDGAPGQMIQGLGEAHNADVLLEPPVQTPFYSQTRLLIECKDYSKKVGLDTVRSALGLREDINHFDIVDSQELLARRSQRRNGVVHDYTRYLYQVALASLSGYSKQAQEFAATHRIPLIEFDKLPFWDELLNILDICNSNIIDNEYEIRLNDLSERIGKGMAIAITNLGQILFLYQQEDKNICFSDENYSIYWENCEQPWCLKSGLNEYLFQLPDYIMKCWLEKSATELDLRKSAIDCKSKFLSSMVVYYRSCGKPTIKMLSIDKYELEMARKRIKG